ncbi:MAG: PAS domain S-box protein [Syntrophobacteraceae bacterium]
MSGRGNDRRLKRHRKAQLRSDQIKMLYSQAPTTMGMSAVGALIITFVLWDVVSKGLLIAWLGLLLLSVFIIYRLCRAFIHRRSRAEPSAYWHISIIAGLTFSGAMLGAAAIFISRAHSLEYQVLLTFLIAGVVGGSISSCSVLLEAFLAYCLPAVVPIMVVLMSYEAKGQMAAGGMLLLFTVLMLMTAYSVYKTTKRALVLHIENKDLIDNLTDAKTQAEKAVDDLQREISERKVAESALQKSEQRFRGFVETMNEGLGVTDENEVITYANDRLCEMLGYSREELIGAAGFKTLTDAGKQIYKARVVEAKVRKRASSEVELVRRNGETIQTLISASPVLDKNGVFRGRIIAIADISVIKLAEKKLRESEEKYRMIFERSPLGILHFDRDGIITACNDNLVKMTGVSKEAIIGFDVHSITDDKELKDAISACIAEGLGHYEGFYKSASSGRVLVVEAAFGRILSEDGTVLGGIGIIEDISERKLAQKKLEDQLHFLQTLIDTIPSPVSYKDVNMLYLGCNKAFENRFGIKREEIIGKSVFDIVPPGIAEKYHAMDMGLIKEPGEKQDEASLVYEDGKTHSVIINKGTYNNADGVVAGVVGVEVDITERKRAEEELRKAHDELELRVRERTAELAMTNEKLIKEIADRKRAEEALKESSEKLKIFAYSVAHDLKSPAVGIYGLTRLLRNRSETVLDEKSRNYCHQIMKASEHVAALVETINVYMVSKEAPLKIEEVDLREILQIVKGEFSGHLAARQVEWCEPDTLGAIRADRLSILRIFRNLVDNALKYGGEQLSEIRIGFTETVDYRILSVSDNGIGLRKEDSERIFQIFQRNQGTTSIEGSGLGLAIVKEIAERHGGKIWIEPGPKQGVTFYVSISSCL